MRKILLWTLLLPVCLCLGLPAGADEGMWLFNGVPKATLEAKYGFAPTQVWLDHLRLSSVQMGDSGSFVSADGLILTNHHVGRECIFHLSTATRDLMKTGFYARTHDEELKCPGLEVEVLVGIEDITAKVNANAGSSLNQTEAANARNFAAQKLQQQCTKNGLVCETVSLYANAMYHLYKYRKYSDIRLVFAPELDIAFFGGDPDNYTFPRYDLDVAFLRAYENNQPARPSDYLAVSTAGTREGELVFASGSPGSTARMSTYAQLEFLRDFVYPMKIKEFKRRTTLLRQYGEKSPENARMVAPMLWDIENRSKAVEGYLSGLLDVQQMARKKAEEQEVRTRVEKDPKLKAQIGDPWTNLEKAIALQERLKSEKRFPETGGLSGRMAAFARTLVRAAVELQKPNAVRLPEFRAAQWPMEKRNLLGTAPLDRVLEELTLTDSLTQLADDLGQSDPRVQMVLEGKSPADRAHELISGSRLADPAFRRMLLEGGETTITQSGDPLITLVLRIDREMRRATTVARRQRSDAELLGIRVAVGRAMVAVNGMAEAPDATGTLRLGFGTVRAVSGGPVFTQLGDIYTYANSKGNQPPYRLPDSWHAAHGRLDAGTPLNFTCTVDVIGGSSGSPLVNKEGQLIGVVFDANRAMLAGNYVYQENDARAIVVDIRSVLEALRGVYGADALAAELATGGTKTR